MLLLWGNDDKDLDGHMRNKEYTLLPKQNLIGLIYERNIIRQSGLLLVKSKTSRYYALFSSFWPLSAAIWHLWAQSLLVQVMACRLTGAKQIYQTVMTCCHLESYEEWHFIKWLPEKMNMQILSPKCLPYCPGVTVWIKCTEVLLFHTVWIKFTEVLLSPNDTYSDVVHVDKVLSETLALTFGQVSPLIGWGYFDIWMKNWATIVSFL